MSEAAQMSDREAPDAVVAVPNSLLSLRKRRANAEGEATLGDGDPERGHQQRSAADEEPSPWGGSTPRSPPTADPDRFV